MRQEVLFGGGGVVGSSRAAGAQGASGGGKHRLQEYRSTRRLGRGE